LISSSERKRVLLIFIIDEKPQKKGWGKGMRKWKGEKGPPKNLTWAPRGLNPALIVCLHVDVAKNTGYLM